METFKITKNAHGSWYDADTLEDAILMFKNQYGDDLEGIKCEIFWNREYFREFSNDRVLYAIKYLNRSDK